MEDINLLPKDLRPKEEEKRKAPSEKTVDFIYPNIKQKEQGKPAKDAGLPVAKFADKPSALKQDSIKNKIQSALLIFKKFKISDLKKILRHRKEKEAPKSKETGFSVDLLKGAIAAQRSPKPELIKFLCFAAIITAFFIGALFYYKTRYNRMQAKVDSLGLEIQNLDAELADLRAKQDSLRNSDKLIEAVYVLLKNRINWLAFLKEIENKTLKTVYYTQLEAKTLDQITITAQAQSIKDCLKQINIFKISSDFAHNVVLGDMKVKQEKTEGSEETEPVSVSMIEFDFDFAVNPEWIAKNAY